MRREVQRQAEHTRLNSNRQLRDDGTCYHPPYLNSSLARAARREAPLLALADHYNLTVISARAAFSDAVARGVAGFDPRQITADSLHPKPCTFAALGRGGHGDCRGTLLISSLMVAYVHSVWSDAARAQGCHNSAASDQTECTAAAATTNPAVAV